MSGQLKNRNLNRHSGLAVTLSVDQVVFKQPIHVGDLVTFSASINHAGRTSMEMGIRVEAEDIRSGVRRHTNSCYFTMVAIGENGRPASVPPLDLDGDLRRRRNRAATLRRQLRREFAARMESIAEDPDAI
jgi:acyl-CoA hydrolase